MFAAGGIIDFSNKGAAGGQLAAGETRDYALRPMVPPLRWRSTGAVENADTFIRPLLPLTIGKAASHA